MLKQVAAKLGAAFSAAAISVVLFLGTASPAMAADYEPAQGTSTNFNKYLVLDAEETVPNATFSFTAAPGAARAATETTVEVLPGIGNPAVSDVTFSPSDPTKTEAAAEADVKRKLTEDKKFATKQATVDFSDIFFPSPGIYRYIITETASETDAAAGIIHDTPAERVLDVYVIKGEGALEVTTYILHATAVDVPVSGGEGSYAEDKTDGFTNEFAPIPEEPKDLRIAKTVTGSRGSRDKYFAFTVTVTDIADEDTFQVSLADDGDDTTNDGNADAVSGNNKATIPENAGKPNPTSVTGAQLKAGVTFYLHHGQNIVIRGLSPEASYTVTENAEDYKSEDTEGKTNSGTIGTVAGDGSIAEAGFTNTRDGIIPTGILLSVIPGIVIILGGAAGLILVKTRKRKRENQA